MGHTRQVSPTVASIMALFALMLLVHQASSIAEEQQEEKRVETAMHQMAKDLESGRRISAKQSQDIVKQFEHLGEYIKKEASSKRGINLINGKPGQVYSIYFEFSNRKHSKRRSS
ncbi:uncharacterized protein LOC6595341 [Drosophila persimilis]|uniref:Uncharacterized protein n=1 Tax=Drosophila pseudoobscura pseudoobscura TaxID=46245 RepID=A0A6I8VDM9_DROPS|nr:uncharacterized protein LOC26533292 [Drosophila pseudoobscura]XP_026851099.1 uncharacterized protein LOC6595341 [Drosophila persimilis]